MQSYLRELSTGLQNCRIGQEPLLVAVSGGADSVALLRGLRELANECPRQLVVAHFNHGLRGVDNDADAIWVGELAHSLQVTCEIGRVTEGRLNPNGSSLEESARVVRYQFLEATAARMKCRSIVLAHTADDQAETVLHHLFRGTGMAGLRGMSPVRLTSNGLNLIRPMLAIRRATLLDYLNELNQPYRTDLTNDDTTMTRNRLRHVILPMLREQMNPQVDSVICRLADQAAEIDDYFQQQAEQQLDRCLKDEQPDACRLDLTELEGQPKYLVREVFRLIWKRQEWPMQAMGYEQWCRLEALTEARETITLPGQIEARFHSERLLVLRRLTNSPEK